jgi:hypothetical protein
MPVEIGSPVFGHFIITVRRLGKDGRESRFGSIAEEPENE